MQTHPLSQNSYLGLFDFRKSLVAANLPGFHDALATSAKAIYGDGTTIQYKYHDDDAGLFGRLRRTSLVIIDGMDALYSRWPVEHRFILRHEPKTLIEKIFGGRQIGEVQVRIEPVHCVLISELQRHSLGIYVRGFSEYRESIDDLNRAIQSPAQALTQGIATLLNFSEKSPAVSALAMRRPDGLGF